MNTLKCPNCGVVNLASADQCIRCKSVLDQAIGESLNAHIPNSTPAKSRKSIVTALVYLGFASGMALLIYTVAFKPVAPKASVSEEASAAETSPPVTEAAPPQGLNVIQPRLKAFSTTASTELAEQNGTWRYEEGSSRLPKDRLRYVTDKLGPLCNGGGGPADMVECEGRRQSIEAQLAADQWNEHMERTKLCGAQIEGEIELAEPGKYHVFGNDIFYAVKVTAPGEEGGEEGGKCITKRIPTPLSATIYLKWSASARGWQGSTKGMFKTVNLAHNKQTAHLKKEVRDKASYERWQKQGQTEANKRMHDQVFRPLSR